MYSHTSPVDVVDSEGLGEEDERENNTDCFPEQRTDERRKQKGKKCVITQIIKKQKTSFFSSSNTK